MKKKGTVAVIGAGLGGLAVAARLAHKGFEVTLFEKAPTPGGKASLMQLGGYRFDKGPSLMTMPHIFQRLFTDLEEDPKIHLKLKKLQILCNYFFADNTRTSIPGEREAAAERIVRDLGEKKRDVTRFNRHIEKIYNCTSGIFLEKSLHEISTYLSASGVRSILSLPQADIFRSLHQANSSFFSNPNTVQLYDRYATYNGSDPYQTPATFNIIPHVENAFGGWMPENGIHGITTALTELAMRKGVQFRFSERVEKILTEKRKVIGLETEQGDYTFESVISNADVNSTYKRLLQSKESAWSRRYDKLQPSGSVMVFYWGVKRNFPELDVHNILFSKDYQEEFRQIFREKRIPDDPTIYIHITSKIIPKDAPADCENWFVLVNVPYDQGQDWDKERKKTRSRIIQRVNGLLGCDLENLIEEEDVWTPPLIEKETGSMYGSLYGISSNTRMAAFLRQRNRSNEYKGLYFCGGSAHPGGGMPLVLLSAEITARYFQ